MFKKIGQKEKLSSKIVNQLEEAIRNKELKPGEKIPTEMEMCDIFGVSRTAVREAIQQLEAKGLITIKKGSGIYVQDYGSDKATASMNLFLELNLDKEYILHVMEMRKIIEPAIAGKAALNRTVENLKNMENYINQLEEVENDNYHREGELDGKFHQEIASAAGNPVAMLMLKPIFKLMPRIRTMVYKDIKKAKSKALEYHKLILEAMKNKDADAAYNLMIEHLKIAEEHSRQIIEKID